MSVWTARGLGVAVLTFHTLQTPALPPSLQTLSGLGNFFLGVAATGWVAFQIYKFRRNGTPAPDNGAAERRMNAAITQILSHLDRSHELTRDEVQKTRHGVIAAVTAPILQIGGEIAVVKNLLIELKTRSER